MGVQGGQPVNWVGGLYTSERRCCHADCALRSCLPACLPTALRPHCLPCLLDARPGLQAEAGEQLPYEPRQTPSVVEALRVAAELPPDQHILGAHAPSPNTNQKWGVYVSSARRASCLAGVSGAALGQAAHPAACHLCRSSATATSRSGLGGWTGSALLWLLTWCCCGTTG